MKVLVRSLLVLLASASVSLFGTALTFDFKDPKGVNAIQFSLDSVLEPIVGTASEMSGLVKFDPADVVSTTGSIVVSARSLRVPNPTMTEHLLSEGWIDAAAHPEIRFDIVGLENVQVVAPNRWSATAKGSFTLKGVKREIAIPVTLTHLPGQAGARVNRPQQGGDLLVVRGAFSIARADYGIKPGQNEDKVAPVIELSFGVVGTQTSG